MDSTGNRWFLLRTILIVAGGGFVFGYDIGIVSTTLLSIKNDIHMTSLSEGWFVGMIGAGGFLGCAVAGPLCDMFGRWNTMFLQNIIFAVGALVTATSHNITQLLIGRFLVGIASVTSAIAGVPYMTEISPAALRGKMICMYEIWVSVGVLSSFLVGYILVDISHAGTDLKYSMWRYAYAIPGTRVCIYIRVCMCA
jgi:MFS family permease